MTPEDVGNVLLWTMAAVGTDSVRLMLREPKTPGTARSWWWWHMVAFMASYSLVAWLGCAAMLLGRDDPVFRWVRVGSFALSVAAFVWRDLLIRRTQRDDGAGAVDDRAAHPGDTPDDGVRVPEQRG